MITFGIIGSQGAIPIVVVPKCRLLEPTERLVSEIVVESYEICIDKIVTSDWRIR